MAKNPVKIGTMQHQASKKELTASIKELLKKFDDLYKPNGTAYSPQVIQYNKSAQKIFEAMQQVTTKTRRSLQNLNAQITQIKNPANELLTKATAKLKNEPEKPRVIPEIAIQNVLIQMQHTITKALGTLQKLKDQLEQKELEAYPKSLDGSHFIETQSKIISSFSKMTEEHKLQQQNLLSYGINTDTQSTILKLFPEIISIIDTVQSTKTQAEETTLDAKQYATMMHAKNNFEDLKAEFTSLSADLNEQIKNKELQAINTIFHQVFLLRKQHDDHPLIQKLERIVGESSDGVFTYKYPEQANKTPSFKQVNESYQQMVQAIKSFQGSLPDITAVNYLSKRPKVFKALGIPGIIGHKRFNNAVDYNFDTLAKNPELAANKIFDLVNYSYLVPTAATVMQQTQKHTELFKQKFPRLIRQQDKNHFSYQGKKYLLEDPITPAVLDYTTISSKFMQAIVVEDLDTEDYDNLFRQLNKALRKIKVYTGTIALEEKIQTELSNLKKEYPNQDTPEYDIYNKYQKQLTELMLSAQEIPPANLLNRLNTSIHALSHNKKQFATIQTEFKEATQQVEIARLRANIKEDIIQASKVSGVYTVVLTNINYEKERIIKKYNANEPRVPLLTIMGNEIHNEMKRIEGIIEELEAIGKNADEQNELNKHQSFYLRFNERIQDEQKRVIDSIKNIMSDERITQLTTQTHNKLFMFIHRLIITPLVKLLTQEPPTTSRPKFFQSETEIKMKKIREETLEIHSEKELTTDENKAPSNKPGANRW